MELHSALSSYPNPERLRSSDITADVSDVTADVMYDEGVVIVLDQLVQQSLVQQRLRFGSTSKLTVLTSGSRK